MPDLKLPPGANEWDALFRDIETYQEQKYITPGPKVSKLRAAMFEHLWRKEVRRLEEARGDYRHELLRADEQVILWAEEANR